MATIRLGHGRRWLLPGCPISNEFAFIPCSFFGIYLQLVEGFDVLADRDEKERETRFQAR